MADLLHADLTYYLRGAGFHIQNSLGNGHAEEDYEQALVYKLETDRVPFRRQMLYTIAYRGKQIGEYYPDLTLAHGKLRLDLKATASITNLHKAQMLSYLAVTGAELGFLMNFGARLIEQRLLLATVAVQQLLPAHIGKLRWAMRELGCPLGLIANFYPTQLDLHFTRLA